MILAIGAFLGFISVAFGAYAEHGLRDIITDEHFRFLMTALRYNQVHAVVIVSLGLAFLSNGKLYGVRPLRLSAFLFIAGTALFSFGIYLAVWTGQLGLLNSAPFGGVTLMAAWIFLIAGALKARRLT